MAGTLTVSGMSAGDQTGERVFGPLSVVGTQPVGETLTLALATGDNTVAVPAGAVACLIVGPTNGTVALTLRTSLNASDGGLPLNQGAVPLLYAFPAAAPTSLIVNAASPVSGLAVAFI